MQPTWCVHRETKSKQHNQHRNARNLTAGQRKPASIISIISSCFNDRCPRQRQPAGALLNLFLSIRPGRKSSTTIGTGISTCQLPFLSQPSVQVLWEKKQQRKLWQYVFRHVPLSRSENFSQSTSLHTASNAFKLCAT